MASFTWSPPLSRATISQSLRASVTSRNQETVPPSHHLTLPPATPSHRTTCHQHAATVLPWHLVRCCDTWCAAVTPGAPPCHRTAVPAPYRHDTSTYIRTFTHLAYFTTHLTAVNHNSVHPDTVWRNLTIWYVAKNSHDYFTGFSRRTIRFPINISQYCAIGKSKISITRGWMGEGIVHVLVDMLHHNVKFMNCKNTPHIFLVLLNFSSKMSIGFRHTGWVWVHDNQPFIRFYLVKPIVRIVKYLIQKVELY